MNSYAARQIPDGQYTSSIYGLIKDQKYSDAISILNMELQNYPRSRAALSLLGFCYYHNQDYNNSSVMYEKLTKIFPEVNEYHLYYAQSLYKAAKYVEALRASQVLVDKPEYSQKITMLQIQIMYEQEEIANAKALLNQSSPNLVDTIIAQGCLLFKENKYEEAKDKFQDAINTAGYQCDLAYNMALCHYKMKQLAPSLKHIADIIEKGVKEHPELGVGSNAEGIEVKSVGNTQVLKETALVEAFNLKAAIEYSMKNIDSAKEALLDMPPRDEDELDPVTLHNKALINIDKDTNANFKKLNFLLQNPPFPPETFPNLLILYCKYQCFDLAADVLAENSEIINKCLSKEDFEFIDALILQRTSKEEAYKKFQELSNRHIDNLRKITKQIQDARLAKDTELIKKALKEYDEALEKYIPVLMAQARIYWEMENYDMVEMLFIQSAEFCSEHETWRLNMAHVLFMHGSKYREAIRYYEPIIKAHEEDLLSISASVLANLCVSYIMDSRNQEAEKLMKLLEKEEEKVTMEDPEKQLVHLCVVNLVIGTLYCTKGNYEFGI